MVVRVTEIVYLGEDAFEHAPAVIKEIHAYLENLFNERELAGGVMLQLMQDVNTMSLNKFQADILATRAQYEQSDAILPFNVLSEGLPEPDRELCQGYPEAVDRPDISLVRDIWSREFREMTCESIHPGVGRLEI